jgi:hypothetical protein
MDLGSNIARRIVWEAVDVGAIVAIFCIGIAVGTIWYWVKDKVHR